MNVESERWRFRNAIIPIIPRFTPPRDLVADEKGKMASPANPA
jgi:hypothetical protein